MNTEEKELLLKDLCARLPYGVICRYEAVMPLLGEVLNYGPLQEIRRKGEYFTVNGADCLYEDVKPYLRPMSSMTKSEMNFVNNEIFKNSDNFQIDDLGEMYTESQPFESIYTLSLKIQSKYFDWLNKNMFDYRGLIPMNLALEAKEGMYKTI